MDADVIVLGAGFAGITAARNLRGAGQRVVVLEARDRIGERTWYREMPGAGVSVQDLLGTSRLMSAVRPTAEAFASGGRSDLVALDVSSVAWVDTLDAEPEAADYLRAFLAAMGGTTLERTSVLPLLWDMVELDYTPADAFLDLGELFTDGTKCLLDAIAAR